MSSLSASTSGQGGNIIASLMLLISVLISWLAHGHRPGKTTLTCTLIAIAGVVLVISWGEVGARITFTIKEALLWT